MASTGVPLRRSTRVIKAPKWHREYEIPYLVPSQLTGIEQETLEAHVEIDAVIEKESQEGSVDSPDDTESIVSDTTWTTTTSTTFSWRSADSGYYSCSDEESSSEESSSDDEDEDSESIEAFTDFLNGHPDMQELVAPLSLTDDEFVYLGQ
ncbi:hypothetical protein BGX28_003113 [Mortierella sp. GBA30]|nr:hypothetical protein BGX28_003113 [Mortierella sp. GBA30]